MKRTYQTEVDVNSNIARPVCHKIDSNIIFLGICPKFFLHHITIFCFYVDDEVKTTSLHKKHQQNHRISDEHSCLCRHLQAIARNDCILYPFSLHKLEYESPPWWQFWGSYCFVWLQMFVCFALFKSRRLLQASVVADTAFDEGSGSRRRRCITSPIEGCERGQLILIQGVAYRWQETDFPFLVRVRQLRFSTPISCRSHAYTPQNFKTHAEDLRRTLN